jgi:hypothetical protein
MTKITLDCRKVIVLDWNDSTHWNGGKQAPCIHCKRPALLRDDAGRPAHKACAQTVLAALINARNRKDAA